MEKLFENKNFWLVIGALIILVLIIRLTMPSKGTTTVFSTGRYSGSGTQQVQKNWWDKGPLRCKIAGGSWSGFGNNAGCDF